MMADLINYSALDWDHCLLSQFPYSLATIISPVPVVPIGIIDSLIWHNVKNGPHTVRSSYRFFTAFSQDRGLSARTSSTGANAAV